MQITLERIDKTNTDRISAVVRFETDTDTYEKHYTYQVDEFSLDDLKLKVKEEVKTILDVNKKISNLQKLVGTKFDIK